MKLVIVICVIALTASANSYKLDYKTGNHERFEIGHPGRVVHGSFRYRNDAGDKVTVEYVADDQGFRVTDTDVDHDDDEDDINVYRGKTSKSVYKVKVDDNVKFYHDDPFKSAYKIKVDDDVNVFYDKLKSAYIVKDDDYDKDDDHFYHISQFKSNPAGLHETQRPNVQFKSNIPNPTTAYDREYVPYKVEHGEVKFRPIHTPDGYYAYKVTDDEVEYKRLEKPGPVKLVPFKMDDDEVKFRPVPINVVDKPQKTAVVKSSLDPQVKAFPAETSVRQDNTGASPLHPYLPFSIPRGAGVDGNIKIVVVEREDDDDED